MEDKGGPNFDHEFEVRWSNEQNWQEEEYLWELREDNPKISTCDNYFHLHAFVRRKADERVFMKDTPKPTGWIINEDLFFTYAAFDRRRAPFKLSWSLLLRAGSITKPVTQL
jgi:hypothetical protein